MPVRGETRTLKHERTIREFTLSSPNCLTIGPVLRDFEGVLSGTPQFRGLPNALMDTLPGTDEHVPV